MDGIRTLSAELILIRIAEAEYTNRHISNRNNTNYTDRQSNAVTIAQKILNEL